MVRWNMDCEAKSPHASADAGGLSNAVVVEPHADLLWVKPINKWEAGVKLRGEPAPEHGGAVAHLSHRALPPIRIALRIVGGPGSARAAADAEVGPP